MITHRELLETIADEGRYTFISTGGTSLEQIEKAVSIFKEKSCPYEIMHCNSSYPMKLEDANLLAMQLLRDKFSCDVGYSGHETGLATSLAAVALGATSLERHITLDRSMYGSDQSASIELTGLKRLLKDIHAVNLSLGSASKIVTEKEKEIMKKLRKVETL